MKPCYVFGPWVHVDPIPDTPGVIIANAVRWHREAPDPSARAEAWYWTGDPGEPSIPGEERGWYGCFGASADSVRLTDQYGTGDDAKARLDDRIRSAGHLFAEEVERWREASTPTTPAPSLDALARELFRASLDGPEVQTRHYDTEPVEDRLRWLGVALEVKSKYIDQPTTPATSNSVTPDGSINPVCHRIGGCLGATCCCWTKTCDTDRRVVSPTLAQWLDAGLSPTIVDTPVGDDRAPDRYMASGRETIDEVRDICLHLTGGHQRQADVLYAAHCLLTAYVYESRAGRKGEAEQDHRKARWYLDMLAHVLSQDVVEERFKTPDPRHARSSFTPYDRETATIPPATLYPMLDEMSVERPIALAAYMSSIPAAIAVGMLYEQRQLEDGGMSRRLCGDGGSVILAPSLAEAEAALNAGRATCGGFHVWRCQKCEAVGIGGFRCPKCEAVQ